MGLHELLQAATHLVQELEDDGYLDTYPSALDLKEQLDEWVGLSDEDTQAFLAEQQKIALIWTVGDVQSINPDLDDEPAMEVLETVHRNHDPECGVCWETLKYTAASLFGEYDPRKD